MYSTCTYYLVTLFLIIIIIIIINPYYSLHVEDKWLTVHFCTSKEMVALRNLNSADSRSE